MLTSYLAGARWFSGKGRAYDVSAVDRIATLSGTTADSPTVTVELVQVSYPATGEAPAGVELYQVPLAHYPARQERIEHAHVGDQEDPELGPVHSYDALHDRAAMDLYLQAFAATAADAANDVGGLAFHRLTGHDLDTASHSTLYSGEQSNSSVAFGDDSLLKVFRKVTLGRNPDIEIHRALTAAANPNVAALYGWIEGTAGAGAGLDLAMLQQFLRTASDGWDLALASVRNLYAEADLHAEEVGGDFAGEAERLGAAVATVHAVLAETFGTGTVETASIAEQMRGRLAEQAREVPPLAPYAAAVTAICDRLTGLGSTAVQRVHGDLHLGQTLRTSLGWKLVDFEGEPARPLAQRALPDSPWRDVAGMLRSFDYAARSVGEDFEQGGDPNDQATGPDQLAFRAGEWVQRNREAFLSGYLDGRDAEPRELILIAAYEADKAVYEVGYEARNRPGWMHIPLAALARLGAEPDPTAPADPGEPS